MIDPKKNNNDSIKDVLEENEAIDYTSNSNSNNNQIDIKQKMRKLLLLIILCAVVLIIILLISSLIFPKKKGYNDIEKTMKNAAIKYYDANKNLLPTKAGTVTEVSAKKLSDAGYMKDLNKYGDDACSGKVVVYNNDDDYVYTPYLDCGDNYTTIELFRKITNNKNIVTSGNGLYYQNKEYVFKGDEVNNYVKINDNIWRIVKIDSNNEIVLIYEDDISISTVWDNRYNSQKNYKSGINTFEVSRINSRLKEIFKSNEKSNNYELEVGILDKNSRKLAVNYKLCTGHRSKTTTEKDNSLECTTSINQKVGLLTLSDYANASLDTNCDVVTKKNCQNYNYLVNKNISGWWLITASSDDTSSVYYVNQTGYVELTDASNSKSLRPVIHLNSKTMYKSGNGTKEKPYTLKY